MRPEIDASYQHISKSEATNLDHDFIVLALNKLENKIQFLLNRQARALIHFL